MRIFKEQIEKEDDRSIQIWRDRPIVRRVIGFIGGLSVLILLIAVIGYPKFREFRKNRLLRSANAFIQTQDLRSAQFLLEQLIREDSANLEARRLFAQVLEQSGSGQGLAEWEYLAKAEPGNAANQVGYAGAALRAGHWSELSEALAALHKLQPDSVDYHRLSAAMALAKGDAAALRQAVEALARVDPGNETTRFNLAALRLNSPVPAEVTTARESLEHFARGDSMRIRATLVLIDDLARRWPEEKNPAKRQALLAQRLKAAEPRLRGVGSFMLTGAIGQHQPGLQDLVEHMKNQPDPVPEDAASLARWMSSIGQTREALVWLEGLANKTRQSAAVLGASATCALSLESWPKLEQLLLHGAWGPVPADIVKYAFQAREFRQAGNESNAESHWDKAVRLSGHSATALRLLYRLAQAWHWSGKQTQILWLLVRQDPGDGVAWQKLSELAVATRDSGQVWRVYNAWVQATPANSQAQIERVVIGLLIRPHEAGLMAQADELYRQRPDNAGCRLARALALWREKRTAEALTLLETLPPAVLAEPRFALVYGLLLAEAGRAQPSERMLERAVADRLLPEELLLAEEARARNHQ